MKKLSRTILSWLYHEFQERDAKVLPLRLFIGLGWMRSGVEKLVEPDWHSGLALNEFFIERVEVGDVAFPIYESLMTGIFIENSEFLCILIMAGELYVGLAIIFGFLTKSALVAGLFMNLNFVLAGVVNPSVFYIVIQSALLTSNIGNVFSLDGLSKRIQAKTRPHTGPALVDAQYRLYGLGIGSILCTIFAIAVVPYIQTFHPAQSIEDPSMLLLILFTLHSVLLGILATRTWSTVQGFRASEQPSIHPHSPENVNRNTYADSPSAQMSKGSSQPYSALEARY